MLPNAHPELMPLRAVVKAEVCISVAGAAAWSHLDCGHVLRFAGKRTEERTE